MEDSLSKLRVHTKHYEVQPFVRDKKPSSDYSSFYDHDEGNLLFVAHSSYTAIWSDGNQFFTNLKFK